MRALSFPIIRRGQKSYLIAWLGACKLMFLLIQSHMVWLIPAFPQTYTHATSFRCPSHVPALGRKGRLLKLCVSYVRTNSCFIHKTDCFFVIKSTVSQETDVSILTKTGGMTKQMFLKQISPFVQETDASFITKTAGMPKHMFLKQLFHFVQEIDVSILNQNSWFDQKAVSQPTVLKKQMFFKQVFPSKTAGIPKHMLPLTIEIAVSLDNRSRWFWEQMVPLFGFHTWLFFVWLSRCIAISLLVCVLLRRNSTTKVFFADTLNPHSSKSFFSRSRWDWRCRRFTPGFGPTLQMALSSA